MAGVRRCLVGLVALTVALAGCGWQGSGTIRLKSGKSIRCPNIMVTDAYVSCEGLEGGEHIYPINRVASVTDSN
jgi:hypothetical protein